MRKFLAIALSVLVASNAFGQSESPLTQIEDTPAVTRAVQEDDTKIEAIEATNSSNVADTRGVTGPVARMFIAAALPSSQAAPSSGQNPPTNKNHHLRNFMIVIALVFVMTIILAAQAKKS